MYCFGAGEDISHDIMIGNELNSNIYIFDPTPRSIEHVQYVKDVLDNIKKSIFNKRFGGGDKNYWNLILNNKIKSDKIYFFDYGLSTKNEIVKFYKPSNEEYVSHTIIKGFKSDQFINVQVKDIKTIMNELNHSKIDLLKLDIEGIECEVIEQLIQYKIFPTYLSVDFDIGYNGENRDLNDLNKVNKTIHLLKENHYIVLNKNYSDYSFYYSKTKINDNKIKLKTFVINLDKRNDRLDYIKEQLKIPFERFSAIDGTKIENYFEEELFQDYFEKMDGKKCSFGEVGCKLSHLKLWSQITDSTLILEDDIKVHNTTFESLKNIQQEINQLKEWDIIYLGGQWTPKYGPQSKSHMKEHTILEKHMNSMFLKETEHFYKRENNNDCTGFSPIYRATGAYMISNQGAQKLLQLMKEDIHFFIQHPLDIWLLALEKAKKVIYYDYFEHPFYQGGFDLVKEECLLKTDIQRGEKKKFIFEKKNTYKFTNEWFNTSELRRNIHKYVDKDQVNTILEIGCYEGQASFFYFI